MSRHVVGSEKVRMSRHLVGSPKGTDVVFSRVRRCALKYENQFIFLLDLILTIIFILIFFPKMEYNIANLIYNLQHKYHIDLIFRAIKYA